MSPEPAGASQALRCSFASEARGDPILATAAPAAGFLLIEQPGAWGHHALAESAIDPEVAATVGAHALGASLRVLLIRRPGRRAPAERRAYAIVDSRPGRERMAWGTFERDEELLELPLDGTAGVESREPAYLVCTHGRHDTCCALRGRPVAAALAAERPGATWECSHVGGDRFAANVVVLPHGFYYGRVSVDDAAALVAAHERSEVAVESLRGRAAFSPAVQAAQHFARRRLGERRIDALEPQGAEAGEEGLTTVRLRHDDRIVSVTVRAGFGEEAGLLTCHASHALHPPTFLLEAIDGL